VAEAGTGGLIGYVITEVPGCSRVFPGGIIAYGNGLKLAIGVPEDVLRKHGAVSAEAALAMAKTVRSFAKTDLGLALTSIAGPTGGSPEKPVGLTFIAVTDGGRSMSDEHTFAEDRSGNMRRSAEAALELTLRFLGDG
jgi:PncC family amidohydrolase